MRAFMKKFFAVLLSVALVFSLAMPAAAATGAEPSGGDIVIPLPRPDEYITSMSAAAIELREGLKARQGEITFKFRTTRTVDAALVEELLDLALAHTGEPTEGDYLRYQMGGYGFGAEIESKSGYNYATMTYTPVYYTTADQEAQVDTAIEALRAQVNAAEMSEYEKVCAIYDYMCDNIVYDDEGLAAENKIIYTAYDALINGTAVCQGYSVLFYRLALELGVDARVVTGIGNGGRHAWNIVRLGGKYYNLDATWDAEYAQADLPYAFFLLNDTDFVDHTRDAEFLTEEFQTAYPMAKTSYGGGIPGDIDGNEQVAINDVIRLLLHVTMPDEFSIDAEADFTGDSKVDINDVIRLLLHVTMPDEFPLEV